MKAWLLEMTEAGFSMWGWDDGPPLVFGAIVASCLGERGVDLQDQEVAATGKRHRGAGGSVNA